jgi:hypothetical protein
MHYNAVLSRNRNNLKHLAIRYLPMPKSPNSFFVGPHPRGRELSVANKGLTAISC